MLYLHIWLTRELINIFSLDVVQNYTTYVTPAYSSAVDTPYYQVPSQANTVVAKAYVYPVLVNASLYSALRPEF